jgi:hypothetical protein
MKSLSNKNEIIKYFEKIYDEIININEDEFQSVTKIIKEKIMTLGVYIFENWVSENIGTGYMGSKMSRKENETSIIYKFHDHLEKHYLTCLGEVKIKRSYYKSDSGGYFPITEKYPWLKDEFFPEVKELACYVSMLEPYELASEMIKKIGGLSISSTSLQKITKTIGNILVKKEDKKVESGNIDHIKVNPDVLVISCDGTCINTSDGWKEVKNGAIYQLKKSQNQLKAINKSYISRIEKCDEFGKRLFLEARRRNVSFSKQVVTIGDGAKWIWEMFGKYYPNSIEIVDWYHATQHLWNIIELLFGNKDNKEGKEFEERCEDLLYSGFIELLRNTIIEKAGGLKIKEKSIRYKSIVTELNYFIINKNRMKYEYFENNNYPIGSGVIEGACKHLVQIRMKRNGMKWSIKGAHDILQLRSLYLSNRWNEVIYEIKAAA